MGNMPCVKVIRARTCCVHVFMCLCLLANTHWHLIVKPVKLPPQIAQIHTPFHTVRLLPYKRHEQRCLYTFSSWWTNSCNSMGNAFVFVCIYFAKWKSLDCVDGIRPPALQQQGTLLEILLFMFLISVLKKPCSDKRWKQSCLLYKISNKSDSFLHFAVRHLGVKMTSLLSCWFCLGLSCSWLLDTERNIKEQCFCNNVA